MFFMTSDICMLCG